MKKETQEKILSKDMVITCSRNNLNETIAQLGNSILSTGNEGETKELFFSFVQKIGDLNHYPEIDAKKRNELKQYEKYCWKFVTDAWLINGININQKGSLRTDLKEAEISLSDDPVYQEKIAKEIEKYDNTKILGEVTRKELNKSSLNLEEMKWIDSNFDKCEFSDKNKELYGDFVSSIIMDCINTPFEEIMGDSEIMKARRELILKSAKRRQDWGIAYDFEISLLVGYGFKFEEIGPIISRSKDLGEKEKEDILIEWAYQYKIRELPEEAEKVLAVCKSKDAREKVDEKIAKEAVELEKFFKKHEKHWLELKSKL